jgi:hypothetical protein
MQWGSTCLRVTTRLEKGHKDMKGKAFFKTCYDVENNLKVSRKTSQSKSCEAPSKGHVYVDIVIYSEKHTQIVITFYNELLWNLIITTNLIILMWNLMHLVENINNIDWWRVASQYDMITAWSWKMCQNVSWDVNTSWVIENCHIHDNFMSTKLLEVVDSFNSID